MTFNIPVRKALSCPSRLAETDAGPVAISSSSPTALWDGGKILSGFVEYTVSDYRSITKWLHGRVTPFPQPDGAANGSVTPSERLAERLDGRNHHFLARNSRLFRNCQIRIGFLAPLPLRIVQDLGLGWGQTIRPKSRILNHRNTRRITSGSETSRPSLPMALTRASRLARATIDQGEGRCALIPASVRWRCEGRGRVARRTSPGTTDSTHCPAVRDQTCVESRRRAASVRSGRGAALCPLHVLASL